MTKNYRGNCFFLKQRYYNFYFLYIFYSAKNDSLWLQKIFHFFLGSGSKFDFAQNTSAIMSMCIVEFSASFLGKPYYYFTYHIIESDLKLVYLVRSPSTLKYMEIIWINKSSPQYGSSKIKILPIYSVTKKIHLPFMHQEVVFINQHDCVKRIKFFNKFAPKVQNGSWMKRCLNWIQ